MNAASDSTYERIRKMGDDTRLTDDFGDDLVWRNLKQEQWDIQDRNHWRVVKEDILGSIHDWSISLASIIAFFLFFICSILGAGFTGSVILGLLIGVIPTLVVSLYSARMGREYYTVGVVLLGILFGSWIGMIFLAPLLFFVFFAAGLSH